MITWMQRHKRWLVSTIWISTIAFVGAGFVGWGSYDYGKKGGAVAVVGERSISVDEYQREYSSLYEQYASIFKDQFNQEMADKLKLKDVAYKLVIEKNLLLSYADELGLDVTNEDIAKELLQYKAFLKNGKFDKDTYIKVLSRNGTTVSDFEDSLKRNILLQKVQKLFVLNPEKSEVKALNELLFLEDNIDLKVINSADITISDSLEDIKKYWETNKSKYMSSASYSIEYKNVKVEKNTHTVEDMKNYYDKYKVELKKADGKIKTFEEANADIQAALDLKATKKVALKEYIKYKKNEKTFEDKKVIYESDLNFGENDFKIMSAKSGSLIKPFLNNNEYIIIKVVKKLQPKELSFDEAKDKATMDYLANAKNIKLEEMAKKELADFKGENIGWVSRTSLAKITGLNPNEAGQFLSQLFTADTKVGKIDLGSKVAFYKINDSRFAKYDAQRDESVSSTLQNLQGTELMTSLIKRLEEKFEIQSTLELEKE